MLIKPNIKNRSSNGSNYYWYLEIDKKELDDFVSSIPIEKVNIKNKTLYLQSKTISQNKLREADFKITRSKDKADLIVIEDLLSIVRESNSVYKFINFSNYVKVKNHIDSIMLDESKNYKYVYNKDIYKQIYKYDGNLELFNNISEFLKSKSDDNVKIAMEMMSNANWIDNEIYLQELFSLYLREINQNSYKSSISFKGFLNSLDFNYQNVYLNNATQYRRLCKTDEHHNWVYDKFIQEFKDNLDDLVTQHKVKIDKLEFSIDKSILETDDI